MGVGLGNAGHALHSDRAFAQAGCHGGGHGDPMVAAGIGNAAPQTARAVDQKAVGLFLHTAAQSRQQLSRGADKSVVDAEEFFLHYAARGWMMGKQPMRNWQAALQSWERNNKPKMAAHEQAPAPVQSAGKHIEYATDADGKKVMTYVE